MNTPIFALLARYLLAALLVFFGMALLMLGSPASRGQQPQQKDQKECEPWQHRNANGDCVDRPHVHHYHGEHHAPDGGEECWVECLCEVGTYPTADTCAPCSFVGTVCISH